MSFELANQKTIKKVQRRDLFARWIISAGGIAIILGVVGILLLIVNVTIPLFIPPKDELQFVSPLKLTESEEIMATGLDDYLEFAYFIDRKGGLSFFAINEDGLKFTQRITLDSLEDSGTELEKVEPLAKGLFTYHWPQGHSQLVKVAFKADYSQGEGRQQQPVATVVADVGFNAAASERFLRQSDGKQIEIEVLPQQLRVKQVAVSGDDEDDDLMFGGDEAESSEGSLRSCTRNLFHGHRRWAAAGTVTRNRDISGADHARGLFASGRRQAG